MKATDIFKDKTFIKCLKNNTYDNKGNYIKIFTEKGEIIEKNINKVVYIDCSNYWITSIEGIYIFKNLETLRLYNNKIKQVPKTIDKLKNLKIINLLNNRIEELPKEICNLKFLESIYLSYNQIKKLPKEIWNLKNLKVLDLSHNQLQILPKEIGKLENLKKLNLSFNQIQILPKEILKLTMLVKVNLYKAFNLKSLKQNSFNILQKLEKKNVFGNNSLKYLKKEVYPIFIKKIEEKYQIDNVRQIKDNLNLDNLNF